MDIEGPPQFEHSSGSEGEYSESDDEIKDIDSYTPKDTQERTKLLLKAAGQGHLAWMTKILDEVPNLVNVQDSDGYSPLHRAAYSGKPEGLTLLIEKGGDINSRTKEKWSPLHSAARWDNWQCAQVLLQAGSDVNAQTDGGHTPLHIAAKHKARSSAITLLLHKDLNLDILNKSGETATQIAEKYSDFSHLFQLSNKVINNL